jgi:hypothetical protein
MDLLSHAMLHRTVALSHEGDGRREQTSIDFVVNGTSLLTELVRRSGGHNDFMGRLAKGLPQFKSEVLSKLGVDAAADTETKRVILYLCPECGDIGCGAYTAIIERVEDGYVWRSFSYENGYEPAAVVENFGPFRFEHQQYVSAINQAANAL